MIWESTVTSKVGTHRVYRTEANTADAASVNFRAGDTLEPTTVEHDRHTPPRRAWTRKVIWETVREAMAFRDGVCWARDDVRAVWIEEDKPCEVLIWVDGDDPDHPRTSSVDVVGQLPPAPLTLRQIDRFRDLLWDSLQRVPRSDRLVRVTGWGTKSFTGLIESIKAILNGDG